jgi:PAS domain S-box-containing protein
MLGLISPRHLEPEMHSRQRRTWFVSKRARRAMLEHRRLRALIERSSLNIALIDADATVRYVTPQGLRMADAEVGSVLGTLAFDWIHPDDRERGIEAFAEALQEPGKVVTLQARALTHSGHYRWVEAVVTNLLEDPDIGALVVNALDITDRKRVEEELIDREKRLRFILERMPATMWTTDRDLRMTLATGAGYASVPDHPRDLLGKKVMDLSGEEGEPGAVVMGHLRALGGGIATYEAEWRGRTWRSHVGPLRDADGICGTIGVSLDITEGALAAERLERSIEAIRKIAVERRELISRLVNAQEDERIRVAREMHDHIGQLLASAALQAKSLEEDAAGSGFDEPLGSLRQLLEQAQSSTRSIVSSIRAVDLDEGGLRTALPRLAEEVRQRHGIEVDVHLVGLGDRLPGEQEIAAYRIVQEALTNAIKHASPQGISIVGSVQEDMAVILIEDDGRGFSLEDVMDGPLTTRLGLLGMQERATAVGADIKFESRTGSGTTVRVRMPAEATA